MSYCTVRFASLVMVSLTMTACGNTEIRGQARDASVSSACFEAGFAPCNSLVVAVQEHRRGNLEGALTSLNVWLSQIGMERTHLTTRPDAFEPIARRSADASRLFGDAVRHPGVGQHIPMRKTATDAYVSSIHQNSQAAPVAPSGSANRGWLTPTEFENSRKAGRLRAVGSGYGFLVVSSPAPGAKVFIGERPYALGTTIENVQSGYREFRVSADAYMDTKGYVLVEPLKVARIQVPLERGLGALTIISNPSNANVVIDGLPKGKTPVTLENLASGMYEVRLSLGTLTWQGRVRVGQGTEVLRPNLAGPRSAAVPVVQPPPRRAQPVQQPPQRSQPQVAAPPRRQAPPQSSSAPSGGGGEGVDLRSLGPELEKMAWANLVGKTIFISLSGGNRVQVLVNEVRGDSVVLTPSDGTGRRVPMKDIVRVEE